MRKSMPSLKLPFAVVVLALLAACTSPVTKVVAPKLPAKTVVVVTGAGLVPHSSADPRYESMWLQVARSYAEGLGREIDADGNRVRILVKGDRTEANDAYLARALAGAEKDDALFQVSMVHVKTSAENTIYLDAEFMPLEYRYRANGSSSVVPTRGDSKRYPVFSVSGNDVSKASLSELARDFVRELRVKGQLD